MACRPVAGAPAAPAASSLGGAPRRRSAAQALSPTVLRFHIEAESQVPVMVQQPAVTGCCHVQHQPALVPSLERLKIQKEQVRLPVDTKEQLTEGRTAASVFPVPAWETLSGALTHRLWAGRLISLCYCAGDRWGNRPRAQCLLQVPSQDGRDLKPRLTLGVSLPRVLGPQAKHPSSLGVCSQEAPLLSYGKRVPQGWTGHTDRLDGS